MGDCDKQASRGALAFTFDQIRSTRCLLLLFLAAQLLVVLLDAFISYDLLDRAFGWGDLVESRSIRRIFNITREDSIGTWLSQLILLLNALALFLVGIANSRKSRKWAALGWVFFALFFLFLSLDDGAKIHERIGTTVKEMVKDGAGPEFLRSAIQSKFTYTWQIVVLPIFALIGLAMTGFLLRELHGTRQRVYFLASFGIMAFSQALDFIEGMANGLEFIQHAFDLTEYTVKHFAKSIEEFLEMFGSSLLLIVVLRHLASIVSDLRIAMQIPFSSREDS